MAGIIAADADNGIGIFGVAPEAQIIAAKACWHPPARHRSRVQQLVAGEGVGLRIAARGAVLNFSLGGPPDPLLGR